MYIHHIQCFDTWHARHTASLVKIWLSFLSLKLTVWLCWGVYPGVCDAVRVCVCMCVCGCVRVRVCVQVMYELANQYMKQVKVPKILINGAISVLRKSVQKKVRPRAISAR